MKTHHMHRTNQVKRLRTARLNREIDKAGFYPLRLFRDSWRWANWVVMLCISPFYAIYYLYRVIFKGDSPVWDGG